jgi:hypothetical protein
MPGRVLRELGRGWPDALLDEPDLAHTWPAGIDRAAQARLVCAAAWWLRRQGDGSLGEAAHALVDVCRWWPRTVDALVPDAIAEPGA